MSSERPGRRRTLIGSAAVLVVGLGLTLGVLKVLEGSPKNGVQALNDGKRFVFVPGRGAPEVTVIDRVGDRVVARIAVSGVPQQILVSDAAGAMVASFPDRRAIDVTDLTAPAKRAQIDLTLTPEVMVLSPDGYLVAAADRRGSVSVVSLPKRRLRFRLSGFGDPRNLTFSSDGSQLFVIDRQTRELVVVDIVQESVFARVALTGVSGPDASRRDPEAGRSGVSALTRTPDGRYGFVSLTTLDSLLVVDLGTFKLLKRLRVGRAPLRPYGTADGRLMLVPNDGDRSVSVIDTTTLEVVATLAGAKDVTAINTGWFESRAFVMSSSQNRVLVLDLVRLRNLGEIELPGVPGAGVVTDTGQRLYVPLEETDQVAVIDTETLKLLAAIGDVGRRPWGATMARSNNYCH